eukprot:TRINITY_DN11622_c0_g1_i1.p1 TRINITY_DN11622_c0_g1~~TRINITY_DN11622_c0_g1_i1.p1  ORF type:complete len:416 (+),score=68.36 TRINITY_DN11622_c0_g1_i1:26-1249(+)
MHARVMAPELCHTGHRHRRRHAFLQVHRHPGRAVLAAAAVVLSMCMVSRSFVLPRLVRRHVGRTAMHWSFFGWGDDDKEDTREVDEKRRNRFLSYAEGGGDSARLQRDGLRSVLECTDSFCMTKHWLPEETLDSIYSQYAREGGIDLAGFCRIAQDGLLLEGKLEEYEKAFDGVSKQQGDTGLISRVALGQLFAGLGRPLSAEKLTEIADEADVGHDGIDFADFLGLARKHLDLAEVIQYLETTPQRAASTPAASSESLHGAQLETVSLVKSESELDAIVATGSDVVVKLAFTWCRPCKAFLPKYEKFAKVYRKTIFLKIVGNENESCKHYAKEVLRAKISPMFAVYSGGKLVTTWTGANNQRFTENMEGFLPSSAEFTKERQAAAEADPTLAPNPPKTDNAENAAN